MTGRTLTAGLLAATLALGSLSSQPAAAGSSNNDLEKALAAIVAIGVVAAAKHKKDDDGRDEGRHGDPFSPAQDVVCLPIPKRCYKNGQFSWKWTKRIFG